MNVSTNCGRRLTLPACLPLHSVIISHSKLNMVREKKEPSGVKEEFLEGGSVLLDARRSAPAKQGRTDEYRSGGRSFLAPALTPDVETDAPIAGDDDERKPSARTVAIAAANTSGLSPNFKDQVYNQEERECARRPNRNGVVASAPGVPVIHEQNEEPLPSTIVAQAIVESSSASTTDLRKHIIWAVAFVVGLVALAVTVTLTVVLSNNDGGGDAPNLALNKPATQSSTSEGGIAARAVDGNTNGDFHMVGSVTHTGWDSAPSWEVDLEGDYYIRQIIVYNRSDCCSERLSNVTIELIHKDGTPQQLQFFQLVRGGITQPISQFVGNTTDVRRINWSFDGANDASSDPPTRKVRVSLPQLGILSLAEVEVFGIEVIKI